MRLVNMHSADLENGFGGFVKPGEAAEFNHDNPAVQSWIEARHLQSEGEVLASRASALVDAPSREQLAALRAEVASKTAVIEDLRSREQALRDDAKRVEARILEITSGNADFAKAESDLIGAEKQIDELAAKLRDRNQQLDHLIAENRQLTARVASLESDLASATAPATNLEPTDSADTASRAKRRG